MCSFSIAKSQVFKPVLLKMGMLQVSLVRNLLVLSLAINVGFFWREVYYAEKLGASVADFKQPMDSQDRDRVINLDQ